MVNVIDDSGELDGVLVCVFENNIAFVIFTKNMFCLCKCFHHCYKSILRVLAVHPIRAELEEPSDMRLAIRISLLICALFYFSIGFFGYLLFGDSINADMLVNFDQISHDTVIASVINVIVRLSYAFHLMLVFPMLNYCLRTNINGLIFPGKLDLAEDKTRFMCLTAILLILAYVVAIAIPSIWYCFQILGSTTIICIMLIFPSMIVLRYVFSELLYSRMDACYSLHLKIIGHV